jgi:sialidase-1
MKNINGLIIGMLLLIIMMSCSTPRSSHAAFARTDSLVMPSVVGNPRTSEGAFAMIGKERILTVYTKFVGGVDDDAKALLVKRVSGDGGATWGDEKTVVADEGRQNVMSVSLLRLKDGSLAMFYLIKNSSDDCYPVMRISKDDGETWSDSKACVAPGTGYFVMNNSRVIQLRSGRILIPVALHTLKGINSKKFNPKADIFCLYSDDNGRTWKETNRVSKPQDLITQEPGVVELKDGSILCYIRTDSGYQYFSKSHDGGMNWEAMKRGSLVSPLAPALIVRDPFTKALVAVWNDHPKQRNPLCMAVSFDEGATWQNEQTLQNDPAYWYCYPAVLIPKRGVVVVSYCFGSPKTWGLGGMKIEKYRYRVH